MEVLTVVRARPFVVGLAALGACGFPDLSYDGPANDGAPTDGAHADAGGSSSSSGADASSSGSGGSDAARDSPSEVTTSDGASSSGGGEAGDPCDQDSDGFKGAQCGGTDCCDTDFNAKPGQTAYYAAADHCGSFDYNCDGKVTPQYGANLHCGYLLGVGCIPTCSNIACNTGYLGPDPGCGNSGAYGQCQPNGIGICGTSPITPAPTQACQ
jgi:hypothetical protein